MYKKILFMLLGICLFSAMGIAELTPLKANEFGDPPVSGVVIGNWNNVMDPHACVLLDLNNDLTIGVRITIGDINLSAYPPLYYTTEFNGAPPSAPIGPLTPGDFVEQTLPGNNIVYVHRAIVYTGNFTLECTANPNQAIPFDYNISLTLSDASLYPIDQYPDLIPPFIYDPDLDGIPASAPITYEGTKNLCCYTHTGPGSFVENNNGTVEIAGSKVTIDPNIQDKPSGGQENFAAKFGNTPNSGFTFQKTKVFPNPFDEILITEFEASNDETIIIQLWDINGRLVHSLEFISEGEGLQEAKINTSRLEAGFYYCKIQSDNQSQTFKVLKLK